MEERRKTRFAEQQGAPRPSVPGHAQTSCCRETFHAAAATGAGGERSWIWAALSLSTTLIGPPHWEQSRRSCASWAVDGSGSVCGAEPSRGKQSGSSVARRRLARNPKLRMRTKPLGSTCNRKRRTNSSSGGSSGRDVPFSGRVFRRCSRPGGES